MNQPNVNAAKVWMDFFLDLQARDLHSAADAAKKLLDWYQSDRFDGVHPGHVGNRQLPRIKRAKEMLLWFRRMYALADGFESEPEKG